eukprot:scaffold1269_cov136-Skeletonema_marinoi.AAC.4
MTANACAVKCNECVAGNVSGGAFRGFSLEGDNSCFCNFDSNAVYTENGSNGSCTEGNEIDNWSGVGQVTGSSLHAGVVSYKIKA